MSIPMLASSNPMMIRDEVGNCGCIVRCVGGDIEYVTLRVRIGMCW